MSTKWLKRLMVAAAIGVAPLAHGAGLNGNDPVAYFTDDKAIKGSSGITAEYGGETYHFATAASRAAFTANPEKYLPQYGSHCAWAVARGQLAPGDPDIFKVVDGKLYLNVNRDIAARWEKDIPGFIRAGDANWPKLKR